jgi:hypothetical protein
MHAKQANKDQPRWTRMMLRLARGQDDGRFVDAVQLGVERRFISVDRAVEILRSVEPLPPGWRPDGGDA